ncbi:MAG TPA: peptidylprolyl isomerase [Chthoniobacterales bacterium]
MKAVATALFVGVAIAAGIFCAQLTLGSVPLREKLGDLCRRGQLLALVHGRGIYQNDVDRVLRESDYLNEIERTEWAEIEQRSMLSKLIANVAAQERGTAERSKSANVDREFNLLRAQFRDDATWGAALHSSGLTSFSLRHILKNDLHAREWISTRIANEISVSDDECRKFYGEHSEQFFVPERLRVSHLFLAAPPETPPEVVDKKRKAIETLSMRLANGEDFAALAAESSEDEATKFKGGDLGYFSEIRMPPDFVAAAVKLKEGEVSQPVQTRLGFHILKFTEIAPSRQRSFEEARAEIATDLANQRRVEAVRKLAIDLGSDVSYLRSL